MVCDVSSHDYTLVFTGSGPGASGRLTLMDAMPPFVPDISDPPKIANSLPPFSDTHNHHNLSPLEASIDKG